MALARHHLLISADQENCWATASIDMPAPQACSQRPAPPKAGVASRPQRCHWTYLTHYTIYHEEYTRFTTGARITTNS